jgi:mRNA-degrading endonuclease toxin of MazEF toxin-antitoxin module
VKEVVVKEIRQGDVYWLDVGSSSGHPWVVVQSDVFNRRRIASKWSA